MFNFNKNEPEDKKILKEEEEAEEFIASVNYKISKDKIVVVDVTVEDYDAYSISQLCIILDLLASDTCYMQTVEILKEGFTNAKEEEALEQIYLHLSRQVSDKILKTITETNDSQPCIRPSQMLQG